MTRKPRQLKVTGGKWPSKEEVLCQYKMEPCQKLTADQRGSIRVQSLNIAMSKIPLTVWDTWISHVIEYDYWPAASVPDDMVTVCLFCHVTDTNCSLCSGIPGYPVACSRHDDGLEEFQPLSKNLKSWQTPYSAMLDAGLEKIQAHADWLEERKNR